MRILHIITNLATGGAEKLMVDLLPRLRDAGNEVELLCIDGTHTPFYRQLESTGIRIHSLGEGVRMYNPWHIVRIARLIHRGKYDIVHTHNTAPQLFAAVAKVVCSVVLCTTEHTTSNRRRDLRWYRPIDHWMYSQYEAIISISPATTTELKKHVSITCPVITIPNGINIMKYSEASAINREKIGCSDDAFLLMMVAGFRYQKDQDTIIRAMKNLPQNVQLCLVGDGERRSECECLARKEGVADRVIFTGIRTDVPQMLKTADVVVMSSHYEGFGLAAVEGMAAGKPVVASDVCGLADIVRDYGCVFMQGNELELSSIIKKLLYDKKLYVQTAKKCRDRANDYDISAMVNAYVDVYKSIKSKK